MAGASAGVRLLLVRHAVTDWNRDGRFQGHLDPPLSDAGRRQAQLLADRLATDVNLRPSRIVSSSLGRALQTAVQIASACGAELSTDARLIEIGQGAWEGRTHDELTTTDVAHYEAWRHGAGRRQPPGAESLAAVRSRLADALLEHLAEGAWPACIVSHGGALRLLAGRLLRLNAARAWALDLDNASLSVCVRLARGTWRLQRWNDTAHLLGRVPTHVDEAEGQPLAL